MTVVLKMGWVVDLESPVRLVNATNRANDVEGRNDQPKSKNNP